MKIKDLCEIINNIIPHTYSEKYDNIGLTIGNPNLNSSKKILITLDVNELVIKEANEIGANLIISFHPIIYKNVKNIIISEYNGKIISESIKNNISIFVIHTNLDNHPYGSNYFICKKIGLLNCKPLIHKNLFLKRITIYHSNNNKLIKLKKILYRLYIYDINIIYKKNIIEIIFNNNLKSYVLSIIKFINKKNKYKISNIEDIYNNEIGIGKIGYFKEPITENKFIKLIKNKFKTKIIKHSNFIKKKIYKIAVLCGSGSFAIDIAKKNMVDAFVSSDLKYHDFFKSNNDFLILDIGHYESEKFNKDSIVYLLKNKITNFDIIKSNIYTNPVNYFF